MHPTPPPNTRQQVYLPSAECYALIPVADFARRRCQAPEGTSLAILDYDLETQSVVLLASRKCAPRAGGWGTGDGFFAFADVNAIQVQHPSENCRETAPFRVLAG